MNRSVAALFASALTAAALPAGASERGDWFKSLLQPGTGKPCCDASDCIRTDADWRDNSWWVEMKGHWVPVPPDVVIHNIKSIDGSAYVCAAVMPMGFARPLPAETEIQILRDGIFCFVPPDLGS